MSISVGVSEIRLRSVCVSGKEKGDYGVLLERPKFLSGCISAFYSMSLY